MFAAPEMAAWLLQMGRRGARFAEIAARAGCDETTVERAWLRLADMDDQAARADHKRRVQSRAGRRLGKRPGGADVALLLQLARAGEAWQAIGLRLYPGSAPAQAAKAAAELFRRHAADSDRARRGAAIRRHNWNKPPGLSERTARRHRRSHRADAMTMPERIDPFAGMGLCFR